MNIVDSSGWLEFFAGGHNAENFLEPLEDPTQLIVPTITIYEVFKVVLRESDENKALQAISAMQKGIVIDLNFKLSLNSAKISLENKIPMADSIIIATANAYDCTIWTQDSDFENLPNVKYFPKIY
ncbi:MAG: VapC toxin family PIN domain ribonuclease [Candidatus Wallbacteria bacterium HGW-Wallbacteria-1]|uniref:VapC toxin family PIN domain ribonuclease n=1 Tax=Candidatus Wallbacteria bacterium HGW-Wallbacteria-1 TaxID=2013854 RepID=A0A2N1PNI0_9BACT|nr:MAG: VapC toxin family PIN domain ribonuclease [Candidatus Wallbacteria bacterium HGW-Wallbacteria-1]